jgi:hypothetical protein
MSLRIPRRQYAELYGPTTGDRIRLADTELLIEIERDFTVPGDEAKFGGGKVLRDGMGQSASATSFVRNSRGMLYPAVSRRCSVAAPVQRQEPTPRRVRRAPGISIV